MSVAVVISCYVNLLFWRCSGANGERYFVAIFGYRPCLSPSSRIVKYFKKQEQQTKIQHEEITINLEKDQTEESPVRLNLHEQCIYFCCSYLIELKIFRFILLLLFRIENLQALGVILLEQC